MATLSYLTPEISTHHRYNALMDTLTILYTQNINGKLSLLPRLYTFLQNLKQAHDPNALLLDLGNACNDSVWHCDVTKGRSTVVVLDGMGYHAINVANFMGHSERDSLHGNIVAGLVTERHMWRYFVPPVRDEDIVIAGQATPALRLCIIAAPADETGLDNRMLQLKAVDQGEVGLVKVDMVSMSIIATDVFTMPKGLKPDATIAASVDLVEDEARFTQNRR